MTTPDPLLERAVRLLLERRGTFLLVVAALTVALGFAASRLEFTTSPETILRSTYGEFANLRSHEKVFGGFEHRLVLVVTAEDVFHPEVRDRIRRATERIGALPSVSRVRSLARPGFPLPAAAVGPAGFRKAVAENRLLTPFLVSRDGTTTALLVDLHPEADAPKTREASMDAALTAARAEGLDPMVTGIPAVRGAYATYIAEDLFVLPPLVGLLLAALLYLSFRRLGVVLALLGVVGLAAVWTVGVMSLTGGRVTALTAILPALIEVVGVATGVHVVAQFREERARGADPRTAARLAMVRMALPCGLTALTTAVGFSSLAVARIGDVREFGLYSAVGAVLAFLLGVPMVGILLSYGAGARAEAGVFFRKPLLLLARAVGRRPWFAIALGAGLAVVSAVGILRLENDTYMLEDVRSGAPIHEATRTADGQLGGVIGFDLVLRFPEGLLEKAGLTWLGKVEERLRGLSGVRGVVGPGTLVREAARVVPLPSGTPPGLLLRGIEARGGEDAVRAFVAEDGLMARVIVRTGDVGSSRSSALRSEVLDVVRADAPAGVEVSVGGLTVLAEELLGRLVGEMGKSVLLAFAVIFLLMSLLFRSLWIGALSMVPNVFPLLAAGGFMGFAGITIRSSIALIFAVALGIAVDDTIHLLTRYVRERRAGGGLRRAVSRAIRYTGRPVVLTSAILCAGFLAFLVSGFKATEQFGLIAAVTIVAALVGDLVILPALLLCGPVPPGDES